MDLINFREFCLSLGGVTEKTPFGKFAARYDSILVFYVEGHMFCFIDIDNFTSVTVKSTPEEIAEMWGNYSSLDYPLNQSLRHWIQIDFNGDVPSSIILDKVKRAYDIVKEKYSSSKK